METNKRNEKTTGFNEITMETLRDRAVTMRDCLARSQIITDSMTSILGSFDLRLSALETAMRPTQVLHLSLFIFLNSISSLLNAF